MRTRLDFDGFVGAAEAAAAPYLYVPFEVPLHCSRLDVSYQYMAVHGEEPCTVDIGIFDVRGTEPFTGGFRGWSGSDRRTFFIERERATPGYVAGPLPSGTWSVLLGLYEVPPAGVRWWVTVELEFAAEPLPDVSIAQAHSTPSRLAKSGSGWYRGDLHSHSEHSDGANTIREIADYAHTRGLDFLAITDHNTTTHHAEMAATETPVLLVPGEEVTTYKGHANVWGLPEWVEFRVTNDAEMQRVLRWVESRQRPMSMNHPKSHGPAWELADPGFAVREVWQAPWRWYNWQSVRAWDEALCEGRRIVPVGGSDAHWVPPPQAPPEHRRRPDDLALLRRRPQRTGRPRRHHVRPHRHLRCPGRTIRRPRSRGQRRAHHRPAPPRRRLRPCLRRRRRTAPPRHARSTTTAWSSCRRPSASTATFAPNCASKPRKTARTSAPSAPRSTADAATVPAHHHPRRRPSWRAVVGLRARPQRATRAHYRPPRRRRRAARPCADAHISGRNRCAAGQAFGVDRGSASGSFGVAAGALGVGHRRAPLSRRLSARDRHQHVSPARNRRADGGRAAPLPSVKRPKRAGRAHRPHSHRSLVPRPRARTRVRSRRALERHFGPRAESCLGPRAEAALGQLRPRRHASLQLAPRDVRPGRARVRRRPRTDPPAPPQPRAPRSGPKSRSSCPPTANTAPR